MRTLPRLATICPQAKATSGSTARPVSYRRAQRGLYDRKTVVPRPGDAQLLLGSHGVSSPEIVEGHHRPAELGRGAQDLVRNHWRKPHLEAREAWPSAPDSTKGCQPGDKAVSLLVATAVVNHDRRVAEVEHHRDGRVRDQPNVREFRRLIAEPCHRNPRQPTGPRGDRDVPERRRHKNGLGRSHVARLRPQDTFPGSDDAHRLCQDTQMGVPVS